jgi:hypothetical protein
MRLPNFDMFKPEFIVNSRFLWQSKRNNDGPYSFTWTVEELDMAEKHPVGLIGVKNGIKCYLRISEGPDFIRTHVTELHN